MRQNHKIAIGFSLLFLAFMLVTTGGGLSWGMTGAFWASGITLAIFGAAFLASSND
jgi:hypothetical protein